MSLLEPSHEISHCGVRGGWGPRRGRRLPRPLPLDIWLWVVGQGWGSSGAWVSETPPTGYPAAWSGVECGVVGGEAGASGKGIDF